MSMSNKGLTKLVEECGEVVQVAAKMIAYPETMEIGGCATHPDGAGPLRERLEDEIADVVAACTFVGVRLGLDQQKIENRIEAKLARFAHWDQENQK